MTLRLVLAPAACAAALLLSAAAPPPGYLLALQLRVGDRIVQHSVVVDRIAWLLPRQRLESFRSQGVVINEEVRTGIVASGVVVMSGGGRASIREEITTIVQDVPRAHVSESHDRGISEVTNRNQEVGTSMYAIENAPMIDLPSVRVRLGSHWITHERVLTSLGSGVATFDHVVAAIEWPRIRINVTGAGTITGKEYNLPHLLPGRISLVGSAWFDVPSGLIVQESYRVNDDLVKIAPYGRLGFAEVLDADIDLHKEGRPVGRMNPTDHTAE